MAQHSAKDNGMTRGPNFRDDTTALLLKNKERSSSRLADVATAAASVKDTLRAVAACGTGVKQCEQFCSHVISCVEKGRTCGAEYFSGKQWSLVASIERKWAFMSIKMGT